MNLKGTVAIVTGGGTGIGRAVSLELAQGGAEAVAVNYSRSASDAEATVKELEAFGCKSNAIQADVADARPCRRAGSRRPGQRRQSRTRCDAMVPRRSEPGARRCAGGGDGGAY